MARCLCVAVGFFFATGLASAQQPIVAIQVAPEKSVFKGAEWFKPIVVKSKEDAAKHFGKDAVGVLTKQVDFQKQVVLIFAWQGSGGDKLTYTVAESFPEQITFAMTPGLTDDLRMHTRVFALRSNVRWSIKGKGVPKP